MKLESVKPAAPPPPTWETLLPCPFCGGAPKMLSSGMISMPEIGSNACVVCLRCGAGGPCIEPEDMRPREQVERQAARLWNRRGTHQNADWKLRRIAQILNSEFHGE